jgi:hypothetical protein
VLAIARTPDAPPLAAFGQLSEKPRQGFAILASTLRPGFGLANSFTAIGVAWSLASGTRRATETGRFLSPDWSSRPVPVPYANLSDPQSLNLYSYVRNNPLSGVDADGHNWFTDFANGLANATYRPLVQAVQHPVVTAQAIGNAVTHPVSTYQAIKSGVVTTTQQVMTGNGTAIGTAVGTVGMAFIPGAGEAGEAAEAAADISKIGETTQLFRAVDATELQSIQDTGSFLPSPNGTDYKGFFFSQDSAEQFGAQQAAGGGPSTTVVGGTAPTALVNGSPVHSAATEGPGVLIHINDLPQVTPQ